MIKCLKVGQCATRTVIYVQVGGGNCGRKRFRSASRKDQILVRDIANGLSCTVKVDRALAGCKCTRGIDSSTTDN